MSESFSDIIFIVLHGTCLKGGQGERERKMLSLELSETHNRSKGKVNYRKVEDNIKNKWSLLARMSFSLSNRNKGHSCISQRKVLLQVPLEE